MKKYHSWSQISRKLRGVLYPLTDEQSIQDILDELFAKLNKEHPKCYYLPKRVCECGKVKPLKKEYHKK